jgi:hypothetical protein
MARKRHLARDRRFRLAGGRERPQALEGRWPSKKRLIMTMDHADESLSLAKFLTRTPTGMFTVYLTGCKLAGGWKIISKIYRYDLL